MKKDEIYIRKYRNGCVPVRPVEITEIFSLFLRCCRTPFAFSGELHEQWELVYVRGGEASITADDKVYRLAAGSLIFHRPMEFHQIHAEKPGLELFVASFRLGGGETSKLERSVFALKPDEKELMEEVIGRCCAMNGGFFADDEFRDCRALWERAPLDFALCVNTLEAVFCRLLLRSPALQVPRDTAQSALYQKIVSVLEEHVYTDITIPRVAERCGVSESTVKACFRRHAGCGVHKYLLKIKMRAAVRMIGEGQAVAEVSERLGFADPNYFSCVFRRETGRRPTDFRK